MFARVLFTVLVSFCFLSADTAEDCFANASAKLEQAKLNITSLIQVGDYTDAEAQTQQLITDFTEDPGLPGHM